MGQHQQRHIASIQQRHCCFCCCCCGETVCDESDGVVVVVMNVDHPKENRKQLRVNDIDIDRIWDREGCKIILLFVFNLVFVVTRGILCDFLGRCRNTESQRKRQRQRAHERRKEKIERDKKRQNKKTKSNKNRKVHFTIKSLKIQYRIE